MASVLRETNGRKTIQFVDPDGSRRKLKIRLGKVSIRDAEFFKNKIERLIACRITGSVIETEVASWISGLTETFKQRLAVLGLVERQPENRPAPLGEFIDGYLASRSKLKGSTIVNLKQVRRRLVDFFGESRDIRQIAPGDADRWRETMIGDNLADATISRHVKRARQFFRAALRRRLISENPFSELPAPEQVNRNREFFVTREAIIKVIDACPDDEWKLIVALCRFGGFRCPSEHFALRPGDIDWEKKRIRVHSSKTEHHQHGGNRIIPLFPELIPYLKVVLQGLKNDDTAIIDHKRWSSNNLRTSFLKIIKKAGFVPWPRVFQNLRASRQTELTNKYPIHVVCEWMGNSRLVAVKHYLQVTDEHFDDAIQERK
jgi:integrase